MQNKHKGFTLIELMVTIAVMAIIAMMAAPSFTGMVRSNQLNGDLVHSELTHRNAFRSDFLNRQIDSSL